MVEDEEIKRIIKQSEELIETLGREETLGIVMEECAEFSIECSKARRGGFRRNKFKEEMADLIICILMTCRIYNFTDEEIMQEIRRKMDRNISRIREHND